jgi:hypothetical protein
VRVSRQPKPSGRKGAFGEERTESSYRRQAGKRQQAIILIVCEGKETEPRYFRALRVAFRIHELRVEVVPGSDGRGAPGRMLRTALQHQKALDLDLSSDDEAWCVFDTEQEGTHADLRDVIERAAQARVQLAISNPAFEYWYLLHYECTDRPFTDAAEVCDQLRRYLPQYTKTMSAFACVKDRTETALANVEVLRKRSEVNWERCPNPSTAVDRLVQRILRAAQLGG